MLKKVLKYTVSAAALVHGTVTLAQDASGEMMEFEELVVTAGRMPTKITSISHSISIISDEQMRQQANITTDLGAMLAAQIPGLAVSSQSNSNFTQTMRGRKPAILIDGVLIGTPLRDGARGFST